MVALTALDQVRYLSSRMHLVDLWQQNLYNIPQHEHMFTVYEQIKLKLIESSKHHFHSKTHKVFSELGQGLW